MDPATNQALDDANIKSMLPHSNELSLISLPDDILNAMFEIYTAGDAVDVSFKALVLSHISHRCREVTLGNHRLWTTICYSRRLPSADFVRLCLERSAGSPLDIVVVAISSLDPVGNRHITLQLFFELVLSEAHRWKNLTVDYPRTPGPSLAPHTGWSHNLNLFHSIPILNNLHCSNLESISLLHTIGNAFSLGDRDIPFWEALLVESGRQLPRLKKLTCRHFVPQIRKHIPGRTFPNISVLSLECTMQTEMLGDLLLSMPALDTLDLILRSDGLSIRSAHPAQEFPSIRTLSIKITTGDDDISIFSPLFFDFQYPRMTQMVLTLNHEDTFATESFAKSLDVVFAKPNRFPSLERLKIVLDMHWHSWARAAIGRVRVPLAIDRIPSLKHLHIVGEFYIAPITDWNSESGLLSARSSNASGTRSPRKFPALETLQFDTHVQFIVGCSILRECYKHREIGKISGNSVCCLNMRHCARAAG